MCEFCEGRSILSSSHVDIRIEHDVPFYRTALSVSDIKKACPPYADCCAKDIGVKVHFKISYCPICGAKID